MRRLSFCLVLSLGFGTAACAAEASWRSSLYPENWQPGFADSRGHFLHDFSYAGYHRGETAIPQVAGPVTNATKTPYTADPSGERDSTTAIQEALDAVAAEGGGVVFLPAGTYRIHPQGEAKTALTIRGSRVILRGERAGKTFLFNDSTEMRGKTVLLIEPRAPINWRTEGADVPASPLARDVPNQASEVFLQSVEKFSVGDLVVLRSDLTQRFIDSVQMTGKWQPEGGNSPNRTLMFCRRVVAVKPATGSLVFDVPVRYPVLMADLGRVVKFPGQPISECALEDFSIGMKQHPGAGLGEEDYNTPGTLGYEVHSARAITFRNAENCWVSGLASYAPAGNEASVHLLSNGLGLERSRYVTVRDCDLRFSQYKGGGGNGYLYTLQGQECLVTHCRAEGGRHNYDFGLMTCSGNVISQCFSKDGLHASDFHMFLSVSNLLDAVTCDGDFLEARFLRPWGGNPMHGVTTTQSVFWNSKGLRYSKERQALVWSEQVGEGYVIGTSGPCSKVDSTNFTEGVGQGENLVPSSLYTDQLARRLRAAH